MSYDRVLPKPLALYYDTPRCDLPSRTSTPEEHQIMPSRLPKLIVDDHGRRSASLESKQQQQPQPLSSTPVPRSAVKEMQMVSSAENGHQTVLASPIPRKRAASLLTSEAERQERAASSSSTNSASSKDSSVQFCLCQPDPKIPRPRNAFILFRQHFQASVVAQNPGLANPEISKIIGEKWRTLPPESKQDWKKLAEDEKARHQQQYPDYRYQPRRYGRNGTNGNQTGSGLGINPPGASICNRCGGRIMNPPSTPSTPFSPNVFSPSVSSISSQPNQAALRNLHSRRNTEDSREPSPVNMPTSAPNTNIDRRAFARTQLRNEESAPPSPDVKRRRFNGNGVYVPVRRDLSPDSPHPYSPRRTALPRPEILQPRVNYPNGAVPNRQYTQQRGTAQTPHDASLTLPPLQTMSLSQQNQSNVEAMVMTIPFINKIKVLARISPPVASSPIKSAGASRGSLVAVEGQDPETVKCMIKYLESVLSKNERYIVRVFEGPSGGSQKGDEKAGEKGGDATVQYLDTISAWHKVSDEIMSFINPSPTSANSSTNSHPKSGSTEEPGSGISSQSVISQTAGLCISTPDGSTTSSSATSPGSPFRIALVPRYQLTTADTHACATPINDCYAPIDHWQWMASLWRGCIGPDITVYIRDCEKEELSKFGEGNPVEIRLNDARTLVVRRPVGSEAGIEEKALRRVGFELEEFLRR